MESETKEPKPDLAALVAADRKARGEAFLAGVEELKKRHRCDLVPVFVLQPGQHPMGRIEVAVLD